MYGRGWLLWIADGRANPLMGPKVVGVVFFEMVAVVTSPQLLGASIYISVRLPVCLSICLSASLKTKLFCVAASVFELDNTKNEAILRDFLNFWSWHQKTKQFCETSFNNAKLGAEITASYQCVLQFFQSMCPSIAPATNEARSYEVLHLSHKIILPKLKIWCSKMQPLSGKLCPWPPNISDEHVFCIAPATRNESSQILFKCPTPAIVFGHATRPSRFARFWQGAQSLAPARRNDIWTPKVFRARQFFALLISTCAPRHNGVRFFDISTSKRGPNVECFVHFDLDMCFAPQRRALFHLSSGQLAAHSPL